MLALSPVPEISISLAPPQEPLVEPFSPFSSASFSSPADSDSFRPSLLSPPPTMSPRFPKQLSPLRPADVPVTGKGLERERFEEMLRASRERNAALGNKRSPDLRKEIAIKVHKGKQMERRALFLSKVQAPPSPGATLLPKTPPESPAIFHYTLPSPGLQSPLAMFEEMVYENPANPRRPAWVEQVEFHVPHKEHLRLPLRSASNHKGKVPSLDQITAHLSSQRSALLLHQENASQSANNARLPAFLKLAERSSKREHGQENVVPSSAPVSRHAPLVPVGRLQFPVRSVSPPTPEAADVKITLSSSQIPPSPRSPSPKLQIRTTVVPHTSSRSPIELSEINLHAFNTMRADTAKTMLTRLRKRTIPPHTARLEVGGNEDEKKLRRRSAPPELPLRERRGFSKPPLNLPGAF